MIQFLFEGQISLFVILLIAIVCSLTLHEYGHASVARLFGDETAKREGRLTLNPIRHIDPTGLLMVVLVGFGWAKPVPFNQRILGSAWAAALVAVAGPFMNLLLAFLAINLYVLAVGSGVLQVGSALLQALSVLARINLLLLLFNLIPLGPLDGHYIFSWLLPGHLATRYDEFNTRYGATLFLVLIVLSFFGLPVFSFLMSFSGVLIPLLRIV